MSKLAELMKNLGSDAELAKAYEENPQKVMEEAGLSEDEMKLLQEGDLKKLEDSTGVGSCQKIKTIIKAYDS